MDAVIWIIICLVSVCLDGARAGKFFPGRSVGRDPPLDPTMFSCSAIQLDSGRYISLSKTIDHSRTFEDRSKIKYKIGSDDIDSGYYKFLLGPGVGLTSRLRELPLNMMFRDYSLFLTDQSMFRMPSGGLYMNETAKLDLSHRSEMKIEGSYLHMMPRSLIRVLHQARFIIYRTRALLEEGSEIRVWDGSGFFLAHGDNITTESGTGIGLIMKKHSRIREMWDSQVNIESGPAAGLFLDDGARLELERQSRVMAGTLVLMSASHLKGTKQSDVKISGNAVLMLLPSVSATFDGGRFELSSEEASGSNRKLFCFVLKNYHLNTMLAVNDTTTEDAMSCTNNPTEAYVKALKGGSHSESQLSAVWSAVGRLLKNQPPFDATFKQLVFPSGGNRKSCSE